MKIPFKRYRLAEHATEIICQITRSLVSFWHILIKKCNRVSRNFVSDVLLKRQAPNRLAAFQDKRPNFIKELRTVRLQRDRINSKELRLFSPPRDGNGPIPICNTPTIPWNNDPIQLRVPSLGTTEISRNDKSQIKLLPDAERNEGYRGVHLTTRRRSLPCISLRESGENGREIALG